MDDDWFNRFIFGLVIVLFFFSMVGIVTVAWWIAEWWG